MNIPSPMIAHFQVPLQRVKIPNTPPGDPQQKTKQNNQNIILYAPWTPHPSFLDHHLIDFFLSPPESYKSLEKRTEGLQTEVDLVRGKLECLDNEHKTTEEGIKILLSAAMIFRTAAKD